MTLPTVTQADLEGAASYLCSLAFVTDKASTLARLNAYYEVGYFHPLVAAFARHRTATEASTAARISALEAEKAQLREKGLGFIAVWAAQYAREHGLPDGHLRPTHFDLIAEFGGNTDSFARAAPTATEGEGA